MSYDEIDIEDMEWNEELQAFTYQCPCGDLFQISKVGSILGYTSWRYFEAMATVTSSLWIRSCKQWAVTHLCCLLCTGRACSGRGGGALS